MNILGVIPARGGSKGVPRKNIQLLNGIPLIKYTVDAALASKLDTVITSTDDNEIASVAGMYGCPSPFIRPGDLASDNARSLDVAIHALLWMEKECNKLFDALMLLQPTTPFRTTADINDAINLLENNNEATSVISVVGVGAHHPARMKFISDGFLIDPIFCEEYENQNRQELQPMYIRNGAIYLTKRDVLLSGSFKGSKSMALIMPDERSVNIDSQLDFDYAEWLNSKFLL